MEAFNLDGGAETPTQAESFVLNGDSHAPGSGSIHDRIKGLKQWPGRMVRSPSGQSTTSSNGKGKGRSGSKKGKARVDGNVDGDGDEEDGAGGGVEDEDEDDYVVRTGHLGNPMEEVE
jgi:peroxin-6